MKSAQYQTGGETQDKQTNQASLGGQALVSPSDSTGKLKQEEMFLQLACQKFNLTQSFIDYAYPRFSDKTKRKMNWQAFEDLEFDEMGCPILEEWDKFDEIIGDEFWVMFGRRRTGKSHLTKWLLWHFDYIFPRGMVVSKTEDMNKNYSTIFPRRFISDTWDEQLFLDYLNLQKELVKKHANKEDEGEPENWYRGVVVLDDCIDKTSQFRNSHFLSTTATQGRHYALMTFLCTQYTKALTPAVRENCDMAVLFTADAINARDALWEVFGSQMQDEAMFHKAHDWYTQDHGALLVDLREPMDSKILDKFYWIKAPAEVPKFFMCSEMFWSSIQSDKCDPFVDEGTAKGAAKYMEEEEGYTPLPQIAIEKPAEHKPVPKKRKLRKGY